MFLIKASVSAVEVLRVSSVSIMQERLERDIILKDIVNLDRKNFSGKLY